MKGECERAAAYLWHGCRVQLECLLLSPKEGAPAAAQTPQARDSYRTSHFSSPYRHRHLLLRVSFFDILLTLGLISSIYTPPSSPRNATHIVFSSLPTLLNSCSSCDLGTTSLPHLPTTVWSFCRSLSFRPANWMIGVMRRRAAEANEARRKLCTLC
jgi:hypothetical protein